MSFFTELFSSCCAQSRVDEKTQGRLKMRAMIKRSEGVLDELQKFEEGLDLNYSDIEDVWKLTKELRKDNALPKKDLQKMYKSLNNINLNHLKKVLTQSFFFTDSSKEKYDYIKIQVFNLIYCGGTDIQKAIFFFELVTSNKKKAKIVSNSKPLLKALEYLTHVSCIAICEAISAIMKDLRQFEDERLEK